MKAIHHDDVAGLEGQLVGVPRVEVVNGPILNVAGHVTSLAQRHRLVHRVVRAGMKNNPPLVFCSV